MISSDCPYRVDERSSRALALTQAAIGRSRIRRDTSWRFDLTDLGLAALLVGTLDRTDRGNSATHAESHPEPWPREMPR